MPASLAHMKLSGSLLSEICNIIKVLQHFSKGHIGAILTIGSHHDELAVFQFFRKVDFCDTSTVILMILKMALPSNLLHPKTWIRIMHFYPSESNSLKRVGNPDEHCESVRRPGGEG